MNKWASLTLALLGMSLVLHEAAHAIYRCQDKEGREVLTDRPAQLKGCVPLDLLSPSTPEIRKTPLPSPSPTRESPEETRTAETNHAVAVPIQQAGDLFVTAVNFNGEQEAKLIVDTGASHTIVSHKLAGQLGLYSDSAMGTVTMNTVGGSVQAPLARVKSLRLGDAEVKDSIIVIHDLPDSPPGIEGLLGLSALRQFQVTLDPTKKVLLLQPTIK